MWCVARVTYLVIIIIIIMAGMAWLGKTVPVTWSDENSSYYFAPVGDRTHDLPHTVASNMDKVSHALTHSATATYCFDNDPTYFKTNFTVHFINFIESNLANRRRVPQTSPR